LETCKVLEKNSRAVEIVHTDDLLTQLDAKMAKLEALKTQLQLQGESEELKQKIFNTRMAIEKTSQNIEHK